MTEINLPLSVVYDTAGTTPIQDVIEALNAADILSKEALSLLPSFIDGLEVEACSLNVRSITQESPLRELFLVTLLVTFQDDLSTEVPPMLERIFDVTISEKYDSIVTLIFMIVLFYGASFAKDAAVKAIENHKPRKMLEELTNDLVRETGKTKDEITAILEAKFAKPSSVKRLISQSKKFFRPSHLDQNAPIMIDRQKIDKDTVRDVPFSLETEKPSDFDKYLPHLDVDLEIHATDRDKSATGWAAVARGVSDRRLKMKLIDPVEPGQIWGRDEVNADIVVVSKLTSDGYQPFEIHLTAVND
jgi:hypothetical protein